MILCTDYVCMLMFFVSTILWHISAWSLRRLSRWISGICLSRNLWCCKMEQFEQFLGLLLALVVGVILIKKITSCLFRLTITLVLLGIVVWFLLNYTNVFNWAYYQKLTTYWLSMFQMVIKPYIREPFLTSRRGSFHIKETPSSNAVMHLLLYKRFYHRGRVVISYLTSFRHPYHSIGWVEL